MENFVFAAVLFAAACHAGWNALIKIGLDPLSTTTLISVGGGLVSLAFLPWFGIPAPESWPWLIASVVIHLVYFAGLAEAYRTGDLGQVYPIARGSAPLMTAAVATVYVGERLSAGGWVGVTVLVAGVFLLSLRGGRDLTKFDRRGVGFALFTAAVICVYSIVDGVGGRLSGNTNAYTAWMFLGTAMVLLPYTMWRNGPGVVRAISPYWFRGLVGGCLLLLSYSIVIWAWSVAPIAIVAALRETSVLFGAAIAVIVLKEPLRPTRIAAALMIVAGLVAIRAA
jgi:drug/metabolite transporter (DMT)-like permease